MQFEYWYKSIATGKTSQAIAPFHFFEKFHFYDFYDKITDDDEIIYYD